MIVLDTDRLRCLEWGSTESSVLRERLGESVDQNVVVSIISYEEQVRGWMALLAKIHYVPEQVHAYSRLRRFVELQCSVPLLNFTEVAAQQFQALRQMKIRIGTMDLKIAASCLC